MCDCVRLTHTLSQKGKNNFRSSRLSLVSIRSQSEWKQTLSFFHSVLPLQKNVLVNFDYHEKNLTENISVNNKCIKASEVRNNVLDAMTLIIIFM